jgi:hypothetical protein
MASGNAAAERRFTALASSHKTYIAIERTLSSVTVDNYDWLDNEVAQEEEEDGGETRFMKPCSYILRVRVCMQACVSGFLQGQASWLYTNHGYNP